MEEAWSQAQSPKEPDLGLLVRGGGLSEAPKRVRACAKG